MLFFFPYLPRDDDNYNWLMVRGFWGQVSIGLTTYVFLNSNMSRRILYILLRTDDVLTRREDLERGNPDKETVLKAHKNAKNLLPSNCMHNTARFMTWEC